MILSTLILSQLLVGEMRNPNQNFPNILGGSGTLRSFSSLPNTDTTFGVQFLANFFQQNPFIDNRKQARNQFRLSGHYSFTLGIPLEVFGGVHFTFTENSTSNAGSITTTTFFENADLGLKTQNEIVKELFYLGGYAHIRAFSGTQTFRNSSGSTTRRSGPLLTGGAGMISTLDFSRQRFPIRHHITLGYRLPNSDLAGATNQDFRKFSLDAFKYHAIVGATALEAYIGWFIPFVEYSIEYALGTGSDPVKFTDNRTRITGGLRISPKPSFAILAAADLRLTGVDAGSRAGIPRNPPYDIFVGLGFQAVGRELFDAAGDVRGLVTDSHTGLPIEGVRVIVTGDAYPARITDSSGFYEFQSLPNGNYQLQFEKEGFQPLRRSASIREGDDVIVDATMEAEGPKLGGFQADVRDSETGEAIARALVQVPQLQTTFSATADGKILVKGLGEGPTTVVVEAPGYETGEFAVSITPEKVVEQKFTLKKLPPEKGRCVGMVKNPDGTPLTAVITVENQNEKPAATQPMTGEFEIALPPGDHQLKIQAENYLPQTLECHVEGGQVFSLEVTLEKPQQATLVENKIILPDAIYFDFNSDRIKPESFPVLDQVVTVLEENQDNFEILQIDGHTDNIGPDVYNQDLSERRAAAVLNYLKSKGISSDKLRSQGFGESRPIATNELKEGRAENRRVEFNLVRELQ